MVKNIGRNDPCPCGSGNKYKKCCLGTEKDPLSKGRQNIVKCSICERSFDRSLSGTFQSRSRENQKIYFCPECNINLSCSICKKKLGSTSFELYSCSCCDDVTVVCEPCTEKGALSHSHHESIS